MEGQSSEELHKNLEEYKTQQEQASLVAQWTEA